MEQVTLTNDRLSVHYHYYLDLDLAFHPEAAEEVTGQKKGQWRICEKGAEKQWSGERQE